MEFVTGLESYGSKASQMLLIHSKDWEQQDQTMTYGLSSILVAVFKCPLGRGGVGKIKCHFLRDQKVLNETIDSNSESLISDPSSFPVP